MLGEAARWYFPTYLKTGTYGTDQRNRSNIK